jgi:GT2 family glycosyltransferase/tetratricopeptide (TPR) repeat protein
MISIIILACNQIEYTKKCIDSVLKNTRLPYELILIDNGSTDGTFDYFSAELENSINVGIVKLIRNETNLGFAAGNNQGIAAARGRYILLLNNDTLVTDGWLEQMIACVKAHPDSGIIGPLSNNVSGPQQLKKVNYNIETGEGLDKFARKFAVKHKGKAKKILRAVGFCMLIKQEVIQKIGGLDERFGKGNFEDDDFSIRALLAGFESWIAEDCFIHHFGSRTFTGIKINYRAILKKNWNIFKKKWGLPDSLPLGSGYAIPKVAPDKFNPERYYIPLPKVSHIIRTNGSMPDSSSIDAPLNDQKSCDNFSIDADKTDSSLDTIRRIIDNSILLAQKGFADRAVKILLKAIKTIKENKDLIYCLADILMNEKQYDHALKILDTWLKEKNAIKFMEIKASCEEALGRDSDAAITTDMVLANNISSPVAFYIKGRLAIKNNMTFHAKECFTKATEAEPAFGPAFSYLGLMEKNNGHAYEALDLMEKGFLLSSTSKETLTLYFNEVLSQKTFNRAEKIFKEVLNDHPENRLINFRLTDILLRQEKYNEAMDFIRRAIVAYGIDDWIIAAALKIKDKITPNNTLDLAKVKGTLTVCMIVKNEEHNLSKCLLTLKSLADEIILVDTGSTDRTKTLAEIFGAKVYNFKWENDFSAARNYSLSKATGSWILLIDADEIISPADHEVIRQTIKKNTGKSKAFSLTSRNYQWRANVIGMNRNNGAYKEETGYGWVPSTKVRLFENRPEIRLEYHVHEMVEPSLKHNNIKIKYCPVPVHHYGKLDYTYDLKKGEEYYKLGIEKLRHAPEDSKAIFELAIQAGGLDKSEEAIRLWGKYNKMSPDDPVAYTNMGAVYMKLGDIEKAISITKKAMDLSPDISSPASNYANYHLYQGKAEISIPVFEMLIEKYPDNHSDYFYLAIAYACAGYSEKAFQVLKGLKNTIMIRNLPKICRNIINQLISFKQYEYAKLIINMMGDFLIINSRESGLPEISSSDSHAL